MSQKDKIDSNKIYAADLAEQVQNDIREKYPFVNQIAYVPHWGLWKVLYIDAVRQRKVGPKPETEFDTIFDMIEYFEQLTPFLLPLECSGCGRYEKTARHRDDGYGVQCEKCYNQYLTENA